MIVELLVTVAVFGAGWIAGLESAVVVRDVEDDVKTDTTAVETEIDAVIAPVKAEVAAVKADLSTVVDEIKKI